ncbi:acyltransferase [Desulfobotulus sp. H1]|uniref:Acyltransferase n=1 Tax=Desulfobotulus pelophilus TaxID=2823377 RepID=A0ABT3N8K7_9BACT|nr:acyltransferase [Desulfobotulus pelophilus]MCW7753526.1 acyltransferase [Desulfobotulus pelophilus]
MHITPLARMKGCAVITAVVVSTLMHSAPLIAVTFVKVLVPWRISRLLCTRIIIGISTSWIHVNNFVFSLFHKTRWEIRGGDHLSPEGWYLVLCNHQSWVDIFALQRNLCGKIPFLKFFLKQELIWVPVMGLVWWAQDFPFMKRYSKEYILKNPHKKGKDLEVTRKACEKFRTTPVSVMNFVEGTRITEAKHLRQKSPFQRLLRPKSAGTAFVLSAMGREMNTIVDVTIAYPQGVPSFWQFICGNVSLIRMHIRTLAIHEGLRGDYFNDRDFRESFQKELNTMWAEKDLLLGQMMEPVWPETEDEMQKVA